MMEPAALLDAVKSKFPNVETSMPEGQGVLPTVVATLDDFRSLMEWLHSDTEIALDYPMCQTAVDYPEKNILTAVYHIYSVTYGHKLEVKIDLPREDPRVPTVSDLWRGCEWFERETYDMYGIVFENHPDLRRIMMTDDWVGWPLRKDYKDSRIAHKPY